MTTGVAGGTGRAVLQPPGGETVRGRTLIVGLLIIAAALPAAGCTTGTADQPPLPDTGWVLSAYGEPGQMELSLRDRLPTLWFEEDGIRGSAGCNTYTASYTSTPAGELHISDIVNTDAFCAEEGVMEQEQAFLEALRMAEQYEIEDMTLTITGGGRMLVLLNNCLCSDEAQLTGD